MGTDEARVRPKSWTRVRDLDSRIDRTGLIGQIVGDASGTAFAPSATSMAQLNLRDRVIETTIAYVGSADATGASNFARVESDVQRGRAGALRETPLLGGSLLSLDWRPREAPTLDDCELTVKLVSTTSSVAPEAVQSVLVDADGIVLVLESDDTAAPQNAQAVAILKEALSRSPDRRRPVVVQINRREGEADPKGAGVRVNSLTAEEWPHVTACAAKGDGVMETLQRAVDGVVESLQRPSGVEPAAPRANVARVEGNPLLGALRHVLQATVSEEISALERRIVGYFESETARRDAAARSINDRLTALDGWVARFELSLLTITERSDAERERAASREELEDVAARLLADASSQREVILGLFAALDGSMERIEAAVLESAERAGTASALAATRADVERSAATLRGDVDRALASTRSEMERTQAQIVAATNAERDTGRERLASLHESIDRIEASVVEAAARAVAASGLAATRTDVESIQTRVVADASAHRDAVMGEMKEYRKALRDEVGKTITSVTTPMIRTAETLSVDLGRRADEAGGLVQRLDADMHDARARIDALATESRAVAARVNELRSQIEHLDSALAARSADVRDSLRALEEKSAQRADVLQANFETLTEEVRKRHKSWF